MRHIHAQNAARHVTDNTDKVSRFVVKDAHLIATSTTRHDQVLLAVEHSCVEHRSRLRLKLLHVILFIICNINFLNYMTILFDIGFSTVKTIPFVSSGALHGPDIKELESIVLSVAASEHSVSVVSDIDRISAHMRPEDARNRALLSDIVDLHGVVPAAREQNVWIDLVELD